jgi:CubicO group peptidase (beta-lactamase class C family)
MKNLSILFISLLLLNSSAAQAQYAVPRDFDSFINKIMTENKLPGLSIAIVKDDSVVFAKGYGVRSLDQSDSVNEHTLFQAASITKSFTATIMGILADRGKIKWTDPVKKHIPELETSEPFVNQTLSIQDILTLRSGILGGDTLRAVSRKELIPQIRNLKISNSYRLGVSSFNLNYALAGYIEEIITGKYWDELISEEIFIPLKMNESFSDIQSALSSTKNVSTPYYIENDKTIPAKWENPGVFSPADAIISNASDLSKWIRLQLHNGTFENRSIISPSTLAKMQSPLLIAPDWTKGIYNPTATFITLGLGWFVSDYKGVKVVEMGGSAIGTTNLLSVIPEEKFGIVIQTNMDSAWESLGLIKFRIIDYFMTKVPSGISPQ